MNASQLLSVNSNYGNAYSTDRIACWLLKFGLKVSSQ